MATPSEKHEIHCRKRYLEYQETPFYRAFRDAEHPQSPEANYAVLKRMEEARQSLSEVERYYAEIGAAPQFRSAPDSVTLEQGRAFFEAHGYTAQVLCEQRMMLLTHPSAEPHVRKCQVTLHAGASLSGPAAQLVLESRAGQEYGLQLLRRQLATGARIALAYNHAEIPVSFCVGEGYGSAFCISDVYTAESCRGQGYAAAAVVAMLGYARDPDLNYTDIFLHCADAAAIRLYERLGFRGSPVEMYRMLRGGAPGRAAASAPTPAAPDGMWKKAVE